MRTAEESDVICELIAGERLNNSELHNMFRHDVEFTELRIHALIRCLDNLAQYQFLPASVTREVRRLKDDLEPALVAANANLRRIVE